MWIRKISSLKLFNATLYITGLICDTKKPFGSGKNQEVHLGCKETIFLMFLSHLVNLNYQKLESLEMYFLFVFVMHILKKKMGKVYM